jgi:hypothetical protein
MEDNKAWTLDRSAIPTTHEYEWSDDFDEGREREVDYIYRQLPETPDGESLASMIISDLLHARGGVLSVLPDVAAKWELLCQKDLPSAKKTLALITAGFTKTLQIRTTVASWTDPPGILANEWDTTFVQCLLLHRRHLDIALTESVDGSASPLVQHEREFARNLLQAMRDDPTCTNITTEIFRLASCVNVNTKVALSPEEVVAMDVLTGIFVATTAPGYALFPGDSHQSTKRTKE